MGSVNSFDGIFKSEDEIDASTSDRGLSYDKLKRRKQQQALDAANASAVDAAAARDANLTNYDQQTKGKVTTMLAGQQGLLGVAPSARRTLIGN